MVTAYDYPFAQFAEQAGIDVVFVSDAFASVGMGRDGSLSVSVDEVVYHSQAVRRALRTSLLLASLPFLSYTTAADAIQSAGRLVREGGAEAVEIEGTAELAPIVRALTQTGIAVVAHVGLTKLLASRTGSYRPQAKDAASAISIIQDAKALADAGAFALVVECVPDRVADLITRSVAIPTIGIGAGPLCDGQGLVSQDLLGMFDKFTPRFARRFASVGDAARDGFRAFRETVAAKQFPGTEHTLSVDDATMEAIHNQLAGHTAS